MADKMVGAITDNADIASKGYVDAAIVAGDTAWVTPALSGTWVAFGSPYATPAYRKTGGIVYLKGLVKNGTINTTTGDIFILPVGFRPLEREVFSVGGVAAFGRADVLPDGSVRAVAGGSTANWTLSGISFVAAS